MQHKPPTIKEIAKRLNISASSVSRALHNHPSIGLQTRTRVQALAKELNYEPNQTAIFFQQSKTYTIGVILPHLSELFFSEAINGIEDTAYKNNYTVLLGQSHDDAEKEKLVVNAMKKHRVDGLIVSLSKNTSSYEHFLALQKSAIPVVFFDRIPNLPDIHYVACNMLSGTEQAIRFLLKKGHRIIGLLNGPEKLLASKQREDGYMQAMSKHRLKFDRSLVVHSDLSREGTCSAFKKLLSNKRKVTAVVAFNDYVVLDAMEFANELKIKVNEDIYFVSYANLPLIKHTKYAPVASVEQFPYAQGQKATEMLVGLLEKKVSGEVNKINSKIILDSQLIIF